MISLYFRRRRAGSVNGAASCFAFFFAGACAVSFLATINLPPQSVDYLAARLTLANTNFNLFAILLDEGVTYASGLFAVGANEHNV